MPESRLRDIIGDSRTAEASLDELLPKRRVVVTIGIDAYRNLPRLHRAVADAEGVQRLMVDQFGFEALTPPLRDGDATKVAIEALVYDQLRELLKPDDALLLFFAGHGSSRVDVIGDTKVEHGYLAPVEAEGGARFSDLIDIEYFLSQIGALAAKHILVVLDACDSGMALGASVKQYRDRPSFARDLAKALSRRVITSAQRDQPALDGGPIGNHSLFTGTLIDGLRWGKAAFGNDFMTSSSIGLYLQQQVGLASESRQTPDFGSFYLDQRGELLLPIGENSFDSLRASAYQALQRGERRRFAELTRRAVSSRPDAPETLYLRFREALIEDDVLAASTLAGELSRLPLDKGRIPLSDHDLEVLEIVLRYWNEVFRIQPGGFPLQVEVLSGPDVSALAPAPLERVGDVDAYRTRLGDIVVYRVTNLTDRPAYVYLITLDEAGRVSFDRLWAEPSQMVGGLSPQTVQASLPFRNLGDAGGIVEIRMFYAMDMFHWLLDPPSVRSRGVLYSIESEEVAELRLLRIYLLTTVA